MNDEELEQSLRALPEPALPAAWRSSILRTARRAAREESRANWPPLLTLLARLFRQNPVTAAGLAAIWLLILSLKVTTPIDPAARDLVARIDPNHPPLYLTAREELLLAESLQRDDAAPILPQQP